MANEPAPLHERLQADRDREAADRRRRTCANCMRGNHPGCTLPERCAHAGEACELALEEAAEKAADRDRAAGVMWGEPPGRHVSRAEPVLTDTQVTLLVGRPGEWARVRTFPKAATAAYMASELRKGHRPAPDGLWSWKGAKLDGGGSGLWARFDGYEKQQPTIDVAELEK